MKLEDYLFRVNHLLEDVVVTKKNGWVQWASFMSWVDKYNTLVRIFNSDFLRQITLFGIEDKHRSKSGKTATNVAIEAFENTVVALKHVIEGKIKEDAECYRFHCFKVGGQCPHEINPKRYKFFVGMPFNDEYLDSYEYGIKIALSTLGVNCDTQLFRADEKFNNVDIMCKICKALRESEYVIVNISGKNPNVMFELGLAYGLNKKVLLLKDKSTSVISDLKGLEYIEYSHAGELNRNLYARLKNLSWF